MPGQDVVDLVSGLTRADAGAVMTLYGAPSWFDLARTQLWYQTSIHGIGSSETGDLLGWALATGDFDDDGRADLAIGVPYRDAGGVADAGAAIVVVSLVPLFADGFESGGTGEWSGS